MDREPNTAKITEIMSTDVQTIDPYAEVEDTIRRIKENKIRKLPSVYGKERNLLANHQEISGNKERLNVL